MGKLSQDQSAEALKPDGPLFNYLGSIERLLADSEAQLAGGMSLLTEEGVKKAILDQGKIVGLKLAINLLGNVLEERESGYSEQSFGGNA